MVEYKSQANKPVMHAHAGTGMTCRVPFSSRSFPKIWNEILTKNRRNCVVGNAQAKNAVVARMAPETEAFLHGSASHGGCVNSKTYHLHHGSYSSDFLK